MMMTKSQSCVSTVSRNVNLLQLSLVMSTCIKSGNNEYFTESLKLIQNDILE